MKLHLVYIVSHVQKSIAFESTAVALKPHYNLTFLLLNPGDSELQNFLIQQGIAVKRIRYRGKRDVPMAFLQVFLFLVWKRPQAVHAHLFDAQLIGLAAAWLARIPSRIYTRHTSNFHHVYQQSGVKYDKLSNALSTRIISISQATDATLLKLEKVSAKKVVKIPHGFNLIQFNDVSQSRMEAVRLKWRVPNNQPIIGVVARFIEWKGIQYIIPAFKKFLEHYPTACLVLCNATGPYTNVLSKLLTDIPESNKVVIPFEVDMAALYKVFDLYVHTPVSPLVEAFGQTYVEALAAGVPSVFTQSGIAQEFVVHEQHAWVVEFQSVDAVLEGMLRLWGDLPLRKHLIENGRQAVTLRFGLDSMITDLQKLYNE